MPSDTHLHCGLPAAVPENEWPLVARGGGGGGGNSSYDE